MYSAWPLIAAAAGVGFGHAVMPDHWAPLAVTARTQRWSRRRLLRTATLAGVAHVAFSLILGTVVIAVGMGFRGVIERRTDLVVGLILVATGVAFAVAELLGRRPHRHGPGEHAHTHDHAHPHHHDHGAAQSRTAAIAAVAVPFGAAASPDLTILPVFLAAGGSGFATAAATLAAFALVTVATIAGLTFSTALLSHRLRGAWIDRGANLLTAAVLLLIGALVAAGLI
jgi:nickel/cobalt transporter (NicO) family protein